MHSLPLSWSLTDKEIKTISQVKWNVEWLALQNISESSNYSELLNFTNNSDVIIRGCNSEFANQLEKHNYSKIQFGLEAVLSIKDGFPKKKSLVKLEKRAKKHGVIEQIPYTVHNSKRFDIFKKTTIHSSVPQLKNLFQTDFNKNNTLLVFKNNFGEWLGGILLSINSPKKLQTELLLRKKNAPNGIMELLVKASFNYAKENSFSEFSLGEVPFKFQDNIKSKKRYSLKCAGKLINFAYNYKGLFNFKNKFNPKWEPLFICSSNRITYKHLLVILFQSNLNQLLIKKISSNVKKHLSLPINNKEQKIIPTQLDFNKTLLLFFRL